MSEDTVCLGLYSFASVRVECGEWSVELLFNGGSSADLDCKASQQVSFISNC
jgi:hypothetical protein